MQRQASFVKPIFLTFIIVGLLFSFAFAQGDNPKYRQKEEAFQMLDLLEGKGMQEVEGDELDFLLDELAEDNGFVPLGLDEGDAFKETLSRESKNHKEEFHIQEGESLEDIRVLKERQQ